MEFWCGDETVAHKYAHLQLQKPTTKLEMEYKAAASAFDPNYGPAMAQMSGDTAIIKVSGGLIAGQAGWRSLYGMVGYEDVKSAVVEAIGRNDVKGVLMYFDTPGGSVNGVEATARLINEAGKIKPIVGYAATAASAGYWLASATSYIVADNTSMVGSLGSILQLVNLVDMYAKEGIKFHTFKSGELKMAGNPNEELSEEAKAHFQMQVDDMTTIFYRNIANYRGMDATQMRRDFGKGHGVLGMRALAGGLIDELGGMGVAMAKLKSLIEENGQQANLQRM